MKERSSINGILVVNKDKGPTSRDVVNKVSRILGTKKIGHTGTLDPMASGVLILTIGNCTKLSEFLTCKYKTYRAKLVLGYETDTLDSTGMTLKQSENVCSSEEIEKTILSFKGKYMQEVPKYSAVKINGRKLYDYARNGEEVELPKREVEIADIRILKIDGIYVEIECEVSKGTYVRSLIRDIGEKLGTYATMTDLIRTRQGRFELNESFSMEDIEKDQYTLLTVEEVLEEIETIEVDDDSYKKVYNGCKLELSSTCDFVKFVRDKKVLALYKKDGDVYRMYFKNVRSKERC